MRVMCICLCACDVFLSAYDALSRRLSHNLDKN